MITCNKCGAQMEDDALFCGICGTKVQAQGGSFCPDCGAPVKIGDAFCPGCGHSFGAAQNQGPGYGYAPVQGAAQKNNTAMIVAIIAAAVVVIFMCVAMFFVLGKDGKNETADNMPVHSVEPDSGKKADEIEYSGEKPGGNFDSKINDFISARVPHGDMAVAVIDNVSGDIYTSVNADSKYVAWGWYLPIYLAYTRQGAYNPDIARGIMSSDAGVCNNSANTAIKSFGGPDAVTNNIKYHFGTTNTSYGRYFGDVNAISDNYTTPTEAASFLQYLNKNGEQTLLSYDTASFGIAKPYATTLYAQVGTENRSIRKELNLFAVVKGSRADYSIAVMTRNSAGIYISELLEFINTEMELRAK